MDFKDIEMIKSEFVAKTQFFCNADEVPFNKRIILGFLFFFKDSTEKKLSFCHKIDFSNPYILAT